jgi:hypothetical protein
MAERKRDPGEDDDRIAATQIGAIRTMVVVQFAPMCRHEDGR